MRCSEKIIRFAAAIALVLATVQSQAAEPPPEFPADGQNTDDTDWSRAHLRAAPALLEQMHRAEVFLDGDGDGLGSEVSGLKADGLLDRRHMSRIRSALDHARGSMNELAAGVGEEREIDGWTARMIAYELGMAADTLAEQADEIEGEEGADLDSGAAGAGDSSTDAYRRRHLADSMRQYGNLLKATARTIVHHLSTDP